MSITFERPDLMVDIVPMTLYQDSLCVLLGERQADPYAGRTALIGGYVHVDKDQSLGDTARRVLAAKAGISDIYIEQLSTFSGPDRDPRGWSASVAYYSLIPLSQIEDVLVRPDLHLVPVKEATGLPFDHDLIIAAAVARIRGKGAYSDLPARFLPPEFSLGELHRTYEAVLGERIDESAFRRKIMERDFLEKIEGLTRQVEGAKRPSQVYRLKPGFSIFDRRF